MDPADVQATFCATLVDEWARLGIAHAVVCPGSRSTPLAVALAADDRIQVHVVHDERSGAFAALGIGIGTGRPTPVLTTSGTAAVELHPAVVEAHHARVPLIACTADRPRRLWGTGAPQTIDQTRLYGAAVRWFAEPGVPAEADRETWRGLARRAVTEATGEPPGPVHLNLELDEPLLGTAGPLPGPGDDTHEVGAADPGPTTTGISSRHPELLRAMDLLEGRRGVVVAGGRAGGGGVAASLLGWPVVSDVESAPQLGLDRIHFFDAILRHRPFAEAHAPEAVLWLGDRPASRVLEEWVATSGAAEVAVSAPPAPDPGRRAVLRWEGAPHEWLGALASAIQEARSVDAPPVDAGWRRSWQRARDIAGPAIAQVVDRAELTEPFIAREVLRTEPSGLFVASSMPVRDVEWYAEPGTRTTIRANRGANGIDGVTSTALGWALTRGSPVRVLLGDLAFLHDSSALTALRHRTVDLQIVVVDNDGGGIFSFLPQARALPEDQFEQLFGTPHGTDVAAVARAHALPTIEVDRAADLGPALAAGPAGPRVVVCHTDRAANVAVHAEVHAAVADALSAAGW